MQSYLQSFGRNIFVSLQDRHLPQHCWHRFCHWHFFCFCIRKHVVVGSRCRQLPRKLQSRPLGELSSSETGDQLLLFWPSDFSHLNNNSLISGIRTQTLLPIFHDPEPSWPAAMVSWSMCLQNHLLSGAMYCKVVIAIGVLIW